MSKFCLNPACKNPRNPEQNELCHGCSANLAESTQTYQFDYYRVTKLLGEGGFGRTYLAEYSRRYNEPRVIKTLIIRENEQNQGKIKELFAREAEQLGHLDHPQIPQLYEYFERDNNLYLVQEFIDGMSLSEEFEQQGPFRAPKIQTILEELLPVLVYIEEQNLLHRDIKPDNIMRRRSDGLLMLIDFGAARVKTGKDPSILTAIYTPGYAAIEHMRGRPVKASDVYSLGVTCIRLLTGCFLSGTKDPIYDRYENRLRWKEYLQERNIKVSERLVTILDKMVVFSLRDRYPDAQAVLEDLLNSTSPSVPSSTVVETEQKPTVPPTLSVPSPTVVKSFKKVGLLAGFAAILTAVVGIWVYLSFTSPISQNKPDSIAISPDNEVDNNDLAPLLESLETQYQKRNYQDCYQLAINNLDQNNSVIKDWIGKCGLEAAKIAAAKIKAEAHSYIAYTAAISITQKIPNTASNYQEVQDHINTWSGKILYHATTVYKAKGQLEEAVKITEKIPENSNLTATLPELISQWQQETEKHQALIDNAQNLLNQAQWSGAKQEVEKIPTDFVFWRQQAQLILDQANQKINAIAAPEPRRKEPAAPEPRRREPAVAEQRRREQAAAEQRRREQAAAEQSRREQEEDSLRKRLNETPLLDDDSLRERLNNSGLFF